MFTRPTAIALFVALFASTFTIARADDDPIPPPLNPGPGYEGILPAPSLPPGYDRDRHTMPYGLQSVTNTPVLHMGQKFRPTRPSIDWAAFIVQNSTQPSDPMPPGPGFLQVSLYSGINTSNGQLSGLLGTTNVASVESNTTKWVLFEFPESISLSTSSDYYLHIDFVGGYQSWVGIRHQNMLSGSSAFGYFYDTVFNNPPQNLNWNNYDLHFAQGTISGDHNADGDFDAADYVAWKKLDGGERGYTQWHSSFDSTLDGAPTGIAVPQPAGWIVFLIGGLGIVIQRTAFARSPAR